MSFFGGGFFRKMLFGSAVLSLGRYLLRNRELNPRGRSSLPM